MSRRGRKRDLKPEERALWAHVVQHVKPLHTLPPPPTPEISAPAPEEPPQTKDEKAAAPAPRPKKPPVPPPLPLATLEPKARRRLTRGAEVDARLDLHGMTQSAAHYRLRMFLLEAQSIGHSVVLVITGKGGSARLTDERGGSAMFGEERGVLRRTVPHWLAAPDLRAVVVGFEEAGRRHGGEGALYVRIRRRR
ncbi:Smr/MutS family protein [Xanthobacter sp. TB0136]|uniref:Smr/MutS family protein n=1 Tax=Xanthobacter sp. TB0136 TaxID=3459177 RepID=UPI004039BB70